MLLHPGFHPGVRVLFVALLEGQAGDQTRGDAAIAAQGGEQPALGIGVAAAVLETLQSGHGRPRCVRLVGDFLRDELGQRLDLVLQVVQAGGQLVSQGGNFRMICFQARLALKERARLGRGIKYTGRAGHRCCG